MDTKTKQQSTEPTYSTVVVRNVCVVWYGVCVCVCTFTAVKGTVKCRNL